MDGAWSVLNALLSIVGKLLSSRPTGSERASHGASRRRGSPRAAKPAFVCENLEPRLLLSAGWAVPVDPPPAPEIADPMADPSASGAIEQNLDPTQSLVVGPASGAAIDTTLAGNPATPSEEASATHELVFLDTTTPNHQLLTDDLLAQRNDGRQIELIVLDPDRDGIKQISETLRNYNDLDAVHIVSHATEGSVKVGA